MTTIGTEFAMNSLDYLYLHELQEVLLQEVQPADAVPARGFSVPVEQKTENFFFTFLELHLGQATS
jgi:hypothetical protein